MTTLAQCVDSTNPDNIAQGLDGLPALRITVLADVGGQVFDSEALNAGVAAVARACRLRVSAYTWAVIYVNQDRCQAQTDALRAEGVYWADLAQWPQPGIYLWAAAPRTPPGTVPDWCPVHPVMVQDRWLGTVDISTVFGSFPARAAGYIDGPNSQWPTEAWARFTLIPDSGIPDPGPVGPTDTSEVDVILYRKTSDGETMASDGHVMFPVLTPEDMRAAEAAGAKVWEMSDEQFAAVRGFIGR